MPVYRSRGNIIGSSFEPLSFSLQTAGAKQGGLG